MAYENYHTHMRLCKHATGSVTDYVNKAIELGMTHLGMSDHGPLLNAGFPRMTLDEFYEQYLPEIHYCQIKYQSKIKLYSGLEIEYFYGRDSYYEELKSKLDYMILGCHYYSGYTHENNVSAYDCNTEEKLEEYVKLVEDALATGFFKILGHPDFFLCGYPKLDKTFENATRRICEACIKNNVYLECNANGFTKPLKDFDGTMDYMYPNKTFFTIASEYKDLRVIVSSDAHEPAHIIRNIDMATEMLKSLGIEVAKHPFE